MSKAIAEQSNRLSIFWLKKHGYLHKDYSNMSGGINWSYGYSENKSSINFAIHRDNWGTPSEQAYIKLNYTHTDYWSGEKSEMDSKIELTTTPCRYGSRRYWFICPLYKSGRYCGRRVGVLFSIGKWFGCRHCGEIAYNSQMWGGRNKGFVSIPDIEKAEGEVKRWYYRGQPTRKHRRVIRLNEKFENGFLMMTAGLKKRYG
ncbi:MAG: hypothetical protein UT53_C0001G0006 [Candidatus Yanofskybacteria bacterium GW2011_GWD2_39_48]|uniref:Uncharacterized protein n=1 Tax=Candidatus Yanofskybacteria bacterium GW2011_GWD2_39_48 TaxID=1619031 RepID=A0A0G0SEB2_9BACT|nr:MAG: hypothetical protein UT53_C0001G0006 [Candidatus Yanofskybacteria bacterium GW2011_GWD2_39_48]